MTAAAEPPERGAGPLIRMLHVITVAAGSAGERGLRPASLRRMLDVLEVELRRLSEARRTGGPEDGDLDDVADTLRRVAALRARFAA